MATEAGHRLAVFRADASPTIGGGHLMRCLALADTLAARGWRCALAVNQRARDVVPKLAAADHEVFEVAEACAAQDALTGRWPAGCDLLVFDHYALAREDEAPHRAWARRVAVIDDLANRPHDCDVLLDGDPAHAGAYRALTPAGARVLAGPSWAPLQEQFASRRRNTSPAPRQRIERVLISFGVVDRFGLCALALDALARTAPTVAADVVIGSASPQLDRVQQAAAAAPNATLHIDSTRGCELMAAADLAIGAGGTTAWERCCLGLPTIVVITADNQTGIATALERHGAAIVAGRRADVDAERLAALVGALADDGERFSKMSRAAFALCDGHGGPRLAALLEDLRAHDGGPVSLRPVTDADAEIILEWQAHPQSRRYFRNPRVPDPAEHRAWLAGKLAAPTCVLNIIEHAGDAAGILRLDSRDGDNSLEVSVLIAPERRGLGIGHTALALLRVMLPQDSFVADVHAANTASQKLFGGAGYRRDGHVWRQTASTDTPGAEEGTL